MKSDKDLKKEFMKTASKDPDKYYPVKTLKKLGFSRGKCKKCDTYYWSIEKRTTCGDSQCIGGYFFIDKKRKKQLSYLQVWKEFVNVHKKLGYTAINRYPVVARWRDDIPFVEAGIDDYIPYIINGEQKPPAELIVEPQLCLRFNDIDNVGITGAHYVCFVMLGEHSFVPPEKYDTNKYLADHLTWLNEGMGIDNKELTLHEDVWAGSGNFGPSVEFFSDGLEISNQVYMQFTQTSEGMKDLGVKALDMGQGYERIPWFLSGEVNSYETSFPTVMKQLRKITKIKQNKELMKKFATYGPLLNIDDVKDSEKVWKDISKKLKLDIDKLKTQVLENAALYSIAEHSRALLVALNDGALPSNTGGGYNLRVILRRALSLIDKYGWNINLGEVCEWHAQFLKPLFPELCENLEDVKRIIGVEEEKYKNTKQNIGNIAQRIVKEKIDQKRLMTLYDSHGIPPELIKEEAKRLGKDIKIPDDFYSRVGELHNKKESVVKKEEKVKIPKIVETKALYYDNYKKTKCKANVLFSKGNFVVLDQTVFYPESGGQDHDIGTIDNIKVISVFKQSNVIVHELEKPLKAKQVSVEVDSDRRKQLTQHHTATHIINAAARKVLGNHINQSGAKKTVEKAHLDITHFASLSDKELKKIEDEANKIVKKKIDVKKTFMSRDDAEKKYGMRIYQGGAVPGIKLRIVEIPRVDVEACGGTHLDNTSEAGNIKILKSSKISDSVVRITFTAGKAAQEMEKGETGILKEAAKLLKVKENQVPSRADELFSKWKKARKAVKKKKEIDVKELELKEKKTFSGNSLEETAKVLSTQPEHVVKTIVRFLKELEEFKNKLK